MGWPDCSCGLPSAEEALWTTRADGRVRLRIEPSCPQQPPYTVHQMFSQALEKYGDLRALGFKRQGSWEHISYSQYYLLARKAAKGFLKVRSPPGWPFPLGLPASPGPSQACSRLPTGPALRND